MKIVPLLWTFGLVASVTLAAEPVVFQARSARDGLWSDPGTWEGGKLPKAGEFVQIQAGHAVTYDVSADAALRMLHVAGTLRFSREKNTRLEAGLIKVEPGDTTTEEGFNCHDVRATTPTGSPVPALEIGTPEAPIPPGITATIRLRLFPGTDAQTLPAITVCSARWDAHGAPMERTWLKLAAPAGIGDTRLTLEQPASGWKKGDRILVTTDQLQGPGPGASFRRTSGRPKPIGTEERMIVSIDGPVVTLDRPLEKSHRCEGIQRCEVANLSRNVVVESADPSGPRGHTMYHHGSSGGISYAEFRHLGKDGVLGKYPIHFHLVRDTMRGSGVLGASVWDSHNRWITVHGTDHLLVRDCVGYQSLGHGYFLEDGTEQWNVFDRNLAVQAYTALPLPDQVLPYDPNDGAGFWWANGRNTFTRNVACENDRYGYHFHLGQTPEFDGSLRLRQSDGSYAMRDVRTVPFLRFEDNESHGEGLFDFRFGDEKPGSVRGDRTHPFIVRNLRAWESHYALRPNLSFFLLDGFQVSQAAYAIYHPNYDAHVYRRLALDRVSAEPLNGGHDENSRPAGDYSYDGLAFTDCRTGGDPLIQLTAIALKPGLSGHFRGVSFSGSESREGGLVNFGGGPKTKRTEHAVAHFFHDHPAPGKVTQVASAALPGVSSDPAYRPIAGWTGPEALTAESKEAVAFPEILAPVDDLPPATLITRIIPSADGRIEVRGVSHDNGEIAGVTVNGQKAEIHSQQAGVADWSVTLAKPAAGKIEALATDRAGNREQMPHIAGGAPE
jgi:hypothetical protein